MLGLHYGDAGSKKTYFIEGTELVIVLLPNLQLPLSRWVVVKIMLPFGVP